MSSLEKTILLLIAVFVGGFVPFAVIMFGVAVGDGFGLRDGLLFLVASTAISCPIWIPVIISEKYKRTSIFFRWIGAFMLLIPVYFYLTSGRFKKALSFLIAGNLGDTLFHVPFVVLVCLCLYGSYILVKSDILRLLGKSLSRD